VRKISIAIIIIAIMAAAGTIIVIRRHAPVESNEPLPIHQPKVSGTKKPAGQPTSILLPVPFTPQAPTANWDQLHNEACEEAAALMAHAYFDGVRTATLTPAYAEAEIAKLTQWQKDTFVYNLDTTVAETARMIREVYGLKTELINDFTETQLRQALAAGQLVIISEQGQQLHNPNYKQPGPVHHMLILRGYTANSFITNDSGTRNGQNYAYSFKTIDDAAGDWDHTTNTVNTTIKIAMIVSAK
jgi:hypothetical protein